MLPAPTAPSEGYAGVRSTWSRSPKGLAPRFSILAHQLRRRFPSNRSLVKRSPTSTRLRRPKVRWSFAVRPDRAPKSSLKTVRCSAALLGMTSLVSRFAHHGSEEPGSRVARQEDHLFRRLFPAGPGKNRGSSQLPAGGDRFFCPFLTLPAVAGLPERDWDVRPDHLRNMHLPAESRKQNFQ